ncbi:MAG: membrane protein insertion efficiency factor YidD [Balneolaceae bacterium]
MSDINRAISWILIKSVRFYQLAISPWTGPSCRHQPTCSSYMIESIKEWGAWKGFWLGLKRFGRCHPWGTSGYDPVPKKNQE